MSVVLGHGSADDSWHATTPSCRPAAVLNRVIVVVVLGEGIDTAEKRPVHTPRHEMIDTDLVGRHRSMGLPAALREDCGYLGRSVVKLRRRVSRSKRLGRSAECGRGPLGLPAASRDGVAVLVRWSVCGLHRGTVGPGRPHVAGQPSHLKSEGLFEPVPSPFPPVHAITFPSAVKPPSHGISSAPRADRRRSRLMALTERARWASVIITDGVITDEIPPCEQDAAKDG